MSRSENRIGVVGDGVIAFSSALQIALDRPNDEIVVYAPLVRQGSATLAAAAMLNSFAEVDTDTFRNFVVQQRFELNRINSRHMWEQQLARVVELSDSKVHHGFGTYVINNSVASELEDANFEAIKNALVRFKAVFDFVEPSLIPRYMPAVRSRAQRALFIRDEGWVNPAQYLNGLLIALQRAPNVRLVDTAASRLQQLGSSIWSVTGSDGSTVEVDSVLLANGASMSSLLLSSGLDDASLPCLYGVGTTIVIETKEQTLTNCVRTPNRGLACGLYSAPQSTTTTVIGATSTIFDHGVTQPTVNNLHHLLTSARESLNQTYDRCRLVSINVGWRPITEDLMPLIGETRYPKLFILNGMRRDGFHCSPILGRIASALVSESAMPIDVSLFRPDRAPIQTYTRKESIDRIVEHVMCAAFEHGLKPDHLDQVERIRGSIRKEAESLHEQFDNTNNRGIPPELFSYWKFKFSQSGGQP